MAKVFRTVIHGTCLLDGKHPPGSKLARECPVLPRHPNTHTISAITEVPCWVTEEPGSSHQVPGGH
jgi:hypothetical protein